MEGECGELKTEKTESVQSVLAVGSYPGVVPSETAGDTGVWPGRIAHVADVEAALAEIAQIHPRLVMIAEDCDCEDIPKLVQRGSKCGCGCPPQDDRSRGR